MSSLYVNRRPYVEVTTCANLLLSPVPWFSGSPVLAPYNGLVATFLDELPPEARERLQPLLSGKWTLPGDHPLAAHDGRRLGDYRLLVLLGPKNNVGSRYFRLFLTDQGGCLGEPPLALGLYGAGPFPAYNWVELVRYEPAVSFGGVRLDLPAAALDLPLFQALSELVPAGGHIMCEYDSPGQQATARILTLGYPPVTSPLGFLMFQAGARSYRDWYISEGGREGPRKLQGYKPFNEEIARDKSETLRRELVELLSRPENAAHGRWNDVARRLGQLALDQLDREGAPASG